MIKFSHTAFYSFMALSLAPLSQASATKQPDVSSSISNNQDIVIEGKGEDLSLQGNGRDLSSDNLDSLNEGTTDIIEDHRLPEPQAAPVDEGGFF